MTNVMILKVMMMIKMMMVIMTKKLMTINKDDSCPEIGYSALPLNDLEVDCRSNAIWGKLGGVIGLSLF